MLGLATLGQDRPDIHITNFLGPVVPEVKPHHNRNYPADKCDCSWARPRSCSLRDDGSICWAHCCRELSWDGSPEQQRSLVGDFQIRGGEPGEDETRRTDMALENPSNGHSAQMYRQGADRLAYILRQHNRGPSVSIYCQGDSTMLRQVAWLSRMIQENAGAGTFDRSATWHGDIEPLDLKKLAPDEFPAGSTYSVAGGLLCDRPSVLRTRGRIQGFNVSVVAALCTRSMLPVSLASDIIQALVGPRYGFSELQSPSLVYVGGAGLHHLHEESMRSYGELRPFIAADVFEDRLRSALRKLMAYVPVGTKVAYFNTHAVCDEKLTPPYLRDHARACANGNVEGCFGCGCNQPGCDRSGAHCAPIEQWQRQGFNATLMSAFGARSLAQRESNVLRSDYALRQIRLVDGHSMAQGKCDMTADGRHYSSLETTEIRAALDLLGS